MRAFLLFALAGLVILPSIDQLYRGYAAAGATTTLNQSAYRWRDNKNGVDEDWFDTAWKARRKITFNNSASTENLTDFPVRVSLTSVNIDYAKTKAGGADLRFTDSNGTTLLDYEIETWNATGTSEVWIKVPQIDAASTTDHIYMYYSNSAAADAQNAVGVWSNGYGGVWHMSQNPGGTAPQILDSTSNNNDGTTQGAMTSADLVAGPINGATDLDGVDDYVRVPQAASINEDNVITVSFWLKAPQAQSTAYQRAFDKRGSGDGWEFQQHNGTVDASLKLATSGGTPTIMGFTGVFTDTWVHVAFVANSGTVAKYKNGASLGTSTYTHGNGFGNTDNLDFGYNAGQVPMVGQMDEIRFSAVARSAEWLEAEHITMNNTMNSFGSEDQPAASWYDTAWTARRKIILNNSASAENLVNFPIRVSLTSANIDYAKTKAGGADVRFTDSDGTTLLDYEIETWDAAGTSEIWVKVPQIDAGSTTDHIYMYYSNGAASDAQNAAGVWSNGYAGVWHMGQTSADGTAGLLDSLGGKNLTPRNLSTGTGGTGAAAKAGKGVRLDGTDDWIEVGSSSLAQNRAAMTFSAWLQMDALPAARTPFGAFSINNGGTATNSSRFTFELETTGALLMGSRVPDTGTFYSTTTSAAVTSGATWHNVAGIADYANGALKAYRNGTELINTATTFGATVSDNTTSASGALGQEDMGNGVNRFLNGLMDEVRISSVARSVDWLEAEYITMNNTMNSFGSEDLSSPQWFDGAWKARRKITLNNSASTENLINFPVRVSLTSANIDYAKTKAGGADLRFTDSNGTTLLDYEIETWNAASTSEIWVKVPQVDAGSTTDRIYMYYDNSAAADAQNAAGVWSNSYVAVYHLKEDPSGAAPQIKDSTGNNNHGTAFGTMTSADQVAGQINGSLDFDGTDDEVHVTQSASLNMANTVSVSMWLKAPQTQTDAYTRVIDKRGSGVGWEFQQDNTTADASLRMTTSGGSDTTKGFTGAFNGSWHHIGFTVDTGTVAGYMDGVNSVSGSYLHGDGFANTDNLLIMDQFSTQGQIDEVRVSSVARSSSWMVAEYKSDSNTLNTFGFEELDIAATTPNTDNAVYTLNPGATNFRLRVALDVGTDALSPADFTFKLQSSVRSGTCDTAFVGESYVDVAPASGAVRYKDNTDRPNGDATGPVGSPVTGKPLIGQTYVEDNAFAIASVTAVGQSAVWEFALTNAAMAWNTGYCFRVVKSDGTILQTYTVIPELHACVTPSLDSLMRHGKAHCSSVNSRKFYW